MKIQSLAIAFFATAALLLSGCSTNAGTGAVIGSLAGAGLGKATANHDDSRAVIGAMLGGIVGGAIGSESDRAINSSSTVDTDPYYNNRPVATTTPYTGEAVSSKASVRHTHKYSSGDRTHTHVGGAIKHSHTQSREYDDSDYVYAEEPYPVRTTIVIGAGYYGGYGGYYGGYPRYYRQRPYRRHNGYYRQRHHNRNRYRH